MNSRQKKYLRILMIMSLDVLSIVCAGGVALLLRFEFSFEAIPVDFKEMWLKFLPAQLMITVGVFLLRKMYHYVWRSVSIQDISDMILSVILAYAVTGVIGWNVGCRMPKSVILITLMLELFALVGMRCFFRFYEVFLRMVDMHQGTKRDQIMLIGAGEAGRVLMRELHAGTKVEGSVACVIDDNPAKWGKYMDGAKIVGGREKIKWAAKRFRITQIIFAIPTADPKEKATILEICNETDCRVRVVPGIYQLVNGEAILDSVKDIQVEDLLGRKPVKLDQSILNEFLGGKSIMVTGGGGSIGSELCRQIARCRPKKLIVLDIYENNAYEIQQELQHVYGSKLDLEVVIASIRDKERVYSIFEQHRPEIVFHAAAHKHVPFMEANPGEAIKNNVFGTYHVVRAAEKFGVKKFVMISTDKAVNPTNFMGATKRFCEMILQSRLDSPTEFAAVRFGNVLGSNGSVVPLFRRQIEAGGPVTITDKRIIRYFMTIPEAAQLVLEAGAMAKQSQIFVLDMGEPVKILSLAENLIRLSGLEPYKDIDIKEIGLRPGEKLYEELLMSSERLTKTDNEKIFIEQQSEIVPELIMDDLVCLDLAVTNNMPPDELIALLKKLVPTYYSPEEINRQAQAEKSAAC